MNEIIDFFSCNSWILVKYEEFENFRNEYDLKLVNDKIKWIDSSMIDVDSEPINVNNFQTHNSSKVVISPTINNYCIIDGQAIDKKNQEYSQFFSNNCDVYCFKIDIWEPVMEYHIYRDKKLVRSSCTSLDIENEIIEVKDFGEKQPFEDENLFDKTNYVFENGYDTFYFPLLIMEYLGIDYSSLIEAMNKNCTIMSL